ncbi:hypothetical protein JRO89_XS15G0066900 [Xanthoceras sorbifolium]|uniref:USP domain-containing protein n=1 Tax=Xanthoceras sorbifolium TaxID=99658 RepID=A0ABQ8H154_9ROSI|nr:hypothetical protein JRO89_XS15G0066900 [Xanthoceras sorbifolium]
MYLSPIGTDCRYQFSDCVCSSGRCQVIHWREVHKQECHHLETTSSSSSPMDASVEGSVLPDESFNFQLFGYNNKQAGKEKPPSNNMNRHSLTSDAFAYMDCSMVDTFQMPMLERRIADTQVSLKPNSEMLTREDTTVFDFHEEIPRSGATNSTSSNTVSTKEAFIRHKSRSSDSVVSAEETLRQHNFISSNYVTARSTVNESQHVQNQHGNMFERRSSVGSGSSLYTAKYETTAHENDKLHDCKFDDEIVDCNYHSERTAVNGSIKAKIESNPLETRFFKSPKSCMKVVGEQSCPQKEMKGPIAEFARRRDTILPNGSNRVAGMGTKIMGLRKSTKLRPDVQEVWLDQRKKKKMLFPYEVFVKFFQCEVFDLSPRGLLNCGNSCYANAVLQCLTCTNPLIIYLLHRSHSRACCRNDWCLMCELEQHVMMLRESGGPLSPSRILLHMRSANCQMGDGSQEDAHEFLSVLPDCANVSEPITVEVGATKDCLDFDVVICFGLIITFFATLLQAAVEEDGCDRVRTGLLRRTARLGFQTAAGMRSTGVAVVDLRLSWLVGSLILALVSLMVKMILRSSGGAGNKGITGSDSEAIIACNSRLSWLIHKLCNWLMGTGVGIITGLSAFSDGIACAMEKNKAANEIIALLVASMQSICLEGLGGERKVDPSLQETTFIQQTFGGHLRSKVKCLSCYHESERYENIMDLTLEIFGWVESLEDALAQFTTPEDLDGENMYRCGRCATYVRARKQLSIHEAPNILTIVLKRFQEGRYGKINKCISFPELLDMIPFMTGTGDNPPLYFLYAVVVHLDMQNASFSGHYVSYVKDMQGSWFRIDDTEVHPVPVSQVMSEGAYILFYMRSCPRPQRAFAGKAMRQQVPASARHCMPKTHKPSRQGQSNLGSNFVAPESLSGVGPKIVSSFTDQTSNGILRGSANKNIRGVIERYVEPVSVEFSDATSSDWSHFTSSDEASFTTESTRDSFSTVDYADTCNVDPVSSDFNTIYAPEPANLKTVCCRTFSNSRPQTRFVSVEKGYGMESYPFTHYWNGVPQEKSTRQVSDSSTEFSSDSNCCLPVKYGSNQKYRVDRTCGHCKL